MPGRYAKRETPRTLIAPAGALSGVALATSGSVTGEWRVYSARIYYDAGGAVTKDLSSRTLVVSPDGRWTFGSSSGTWSVGPIGAADWRRWGVSRYGPKRKLVLNGWSRSAADGPIEESSRVDFLWVIYRAAPPPVGAAGTVWLKLGRLRPWPTGFARVARDNRPHCMLPRVPARKGGEMAVVTVFQHPSLTQERYEESVRRISPSGRLDSPADWPDEGLLVHIAGQGPSGFRVVDVWASEEAFMSFGQTLMPILEELGVEGQPEIYPAHTVVTA